MPERTSGTEGLDRIDAMGRIGEGKHRALVAQLLPRGRWKRRGNNVTYLAMKTVFALTVIVSALLLTPASAQNYSGLTINGSAGSSFTEANGQSISPGSTTGFANDTGSAFQSFNLSNFSYANFDNGTLNGNLSGFQLCDFDHASLQNATLAAVGSSAWEGDSFEYANLQGATLLGNSTSSWGGIDFYHANLQGATFSGNGTSSWQDVDFAGANLQGANFSGNGLSSFQGLNFSGADLQGATFDPSTIFPDGKNYQTTSINWAADGMILIAAPEPSSWILGVVAMLSLTLLRRKAFPGSFAGSAIRK